MATVNTDDFLEHYGVKGMKWGERRAHGKAMRGLDRESKARDKAKSRGDIDSARARIKSGESARAVKDAKKQYKTDKNVIGKREARKALTKAKEQYVKDLETSQQLRDGKEVFGAIAKEVLLGSSSNLWK